MKSAQEISETLAEPAIETCKHILAQHYGDRLRSVILYGSAARRELTDSSDIDLLVLLSQPLDYFKELRIIVDLLYPMQLEANHWISAKPAGFDEFEAGINQLYRNVKREGIAL
ncbi:MAG: nucleotidyltransferase domain-containing protein [Leptolyngbya sp. SIO4C5]|nr:nucleotidyltransferase domain-containing protein [Leptolyngbya sp. SIO4C5]